MVRLRKITQSVMPNYLIPDGPIPSRFQHGMGVYYLATKVLENNRSLKYFNLILPIAGLLHDAGNPPLSHLGEHFLKEVTGKDGESFLEDILEGSETQKVLMRLGITVEQVVAIVTGNLKPVSDVLNGSIDIDNLDNIARYYEASGFGKCPYNPVNIAESFRFSSENWHLLYDCHPDATTWKETRKKVYSDIIYSEPHLNLATMIYRALEIAFSAGEIKREFFFFDDHEAIEYLLKCASLPTRRLTNEAVCWRWYPEVYNFKPPETPWRFKNSPNWKNRKYLADILCFRLGVPDDMVCVSIGEGKEVRNITLPFVSEDGLTFYHDSGENIKLAPRICVFVSPEIVEKKKRIAEVVEAEIF